MFYIIFSSHFLILLLPTKIWIEKKLAPDYQFALIILDIKVGHLLSDSNSKLAIEFGDRILLNNISSKVSEIFGGIEIESEFRQ